MPDLAKRDTPLRAQPQTTFRRETTMPRQATDLPGLSVNAQIHRADMSKADALSALLAQVNKTGQGILGDIQEANNNADAGAAAMDFATNSKDPEKFAKSRAYRDAWQLQGAKKLAVDVSTEVTDKFNAALNDPDHPATIEDLDALFEDTIKKHLVDETGKPLDFITPQAKTTLGNALLKLKTDLMPKAAEAIKTQQDTKLFATTFHNMTFERDAGQPLGTPPDAAPAAPAKGQPKVVQFGNPTGKLPIQGVITSSYQAHIARGSHGVDIDGRMGDPVTAPAGGKVTVGEDARSGLFVKIDHGGGVVSSYAHLSHTDLKSGEVIQAGQTLGKVGNSGHTVGEGGGDGSHLHYRIRVDGRDVNPLTYNFKGGGAAAVMASGSEPQLKAGIPHPDQLRPGFDVEGFMAALPPSVDKGQAKSWLLQELSAQVASTGDTSLLNGLENLKRKDGSPSFSPAEQLKIVQYREQQEEQNRIKADRATAELQKENGKSVLQAFIEGKPPSEDWLAEQSRKGLLDENFVYTMVNHIQEERKADARQAKMDLRQDQMEADNDLDAMVYGMEAARRAGILDGSSYQEDLKRFRDGDLGTGKKAAARLLRLQAASKVGQKMTEQDPQFAYYGSQLKVNFAPRKINSSSVLILKQSGPVVPEPVYREMVSAYEEKVHSGEKPGDAYREVVKQYAKQAQAPKDELADIRQQIAALRAKRGN